MPDVTPWPVAAVCVGIHPYAAGTFLNGRFERSLLGRSDLVLLVDAEPFDFYNRPRCFDAPAFALTGDGPSDRLNDVAVAPAVRAAARVTA